MRRKLLIVGANGLLGQACLRRANEGDWAAVGIDVEGIDIADADSVEAVMDRESPSAVINCAAYTDVDGAETAEGRAIADRVNSDGPGVLAASCVRHGTAFIHLSTDYAFNGTSRDGASESDVPGPAMNAYGETKLAGERRVIEAFGGLVGSDFRLQNPPGYLVRTSWLFGASARNFVGKIAERARTMGKISVVTDEVGSPTYVEDLAGRLLYLLDHPEIHSGIYHVTGRGACSRFEFARAVIEGLGIKADVEPMSLADFPRKARIVPVSVLKNTKLPAMASWQEMVERYAATVRLRDNDTV